jgi:TolB-like protein/DNA-binding SARP family transcriptional activator
MFRLKLFGAPVLERDGVPVTGRAAQRHRLALLALLAMAPGGRVGRDKLMATLWPESDAEQGRNLLKVASYVLRSALGDEALLSAGDELRLNGDVVRSDVAQFEEALEAGDHARAVATCEGPFMDGFFLQGAPEFEQWVARERERLARQLRRALEALAAAAESAHDWPAAESWWKTLAAQDPYDSRVALRLMQALDANGNRAGALQLASVHERLLQQEFGVAGAPDVSALAERLRHAPSRQIEHPRGTAPPDEPRVAAPPPPAAAPVPEPAWRTAVRATARRRAWAVAALLAVAAVVPVTWAALRPPAATERSIVVLPFANLSANADDEYFSDGLTEEIIGRLAGVPGLRVISRTSAMHYKGTRKPLPEIARELGVDHILEGSVRHDAGRARVSAQLIDARDDAHLWAEHYELDLDDRLRVQERIARKSFSDISIVLLTLTLLVTYPFSLQQVDDPAPTVSRSGRPIDLLPSGPISLIGHNAPSLAALMHRNIRFKKTTTKRLKVSPSVVAATLAQAFKVNS